MVGMRATKTAAEGTRVNLEPLHGGGPNFNK
jgi:hypothetical protein